MATLELCDLCNGKIKKDKATITIEGRLRLHDGKLPPLPDGFKYREEDGDDFGVRYVKVWSNMGKILKETHLVEKPQQFKNVRIVYDLCESCLPKLTSLLEKIRQQYHLEQKEIECLDSSMGGFFKGWGIPHDDEDN